MKVSFVLLAVSTIGAGDLHHVAKDLEAIERRDVAAVIAGLVEPAPISTMGRTNFGEAAVTYAGIHRLSEAAGESPKEWMRKTRRRCVVGTLLVYTHLHKKVHKILLDLETTHNRWDEGTSIANP